MKNSSLSIIEALIIRIGASGYGRKKISKSDIKRANRLFKKAGNIIGQTIEVDDDSQPQAKK